MILIYYSDKKLPKRLHFLEAEDQVYENRPQSIAELKVAITKKIRAIRN